MHSMQRSVVPGRYAVDLVVSMDSDEQARLPEPKRPQREQAAREGRVHR